MRPVDMISDAEVDRVHAHANFGDSTNRDIVNMSVKSVAKRQHVGSTARRIMLEHVLARKSRDKKRQRALVLTPFGRRYLEAVERSEAV